MVDFAQFRNTEDVPNWTARSQGVRAPDWGGIISDLGKSVVGGIEAVTQAEMNTAAEEARNVIEETYTEYFPTEQGGNTKDLPDGLKNSLSRIDTLSSAAKKAGMSKAGYFNAQIMSRLKDVRAKYGGLYDDEIDTAVTKFTGRNPRGELYDILKEQEASQNRKLEAEYKENLKIFNSDSAKILFPNITANELANAPNTQDIIRQVRERESLTARVDEMTKLDYLDERSLEAEAALIVRDTMTQVYNTVNFTKELSPQEFEQSVTNLAPLRTQLVKQLQQLQFSEKYAGRLDSAKAEAIVKRNIAFIDQVYNTLASGDLNATQVLVAANTYNETSLNANLRRVMPEQYNQFALMKNMPPAVSQIFMAKLAGTPEGEKFKKNVGSIMTMAAMIGGNKKAPLAIHNTLIDPEVPEEEKRSLLNSILDTSTTLAEQAPEESKALFDVISQPDKLADISNLFTTGYAKFYTRLTSPSFVKVEDVENPDSYYTNILRALKNTDKFTDDVVRLNDAARSGGGISFNPSTGTLVYTRDPKRVTGGVYARSRFAPEIPDTAGESVTKEIIGKLNPIINNYYTMLKEKYSDPEEANQRMNVMLGTLGIQAEVSQVQGEEVSSAQPDIQITPTSGTTTMAEFMGTDDRVASLYSDPVNLDIAAKTLVGEARGESSEGRQAIAEVLRNRSLASGRSIAEEAQLRKGKSKFGQFSTWNEGDPNLKLIEDLDETSPLYETAAQDFLTSANSDITKGATHYYNPDIADPDWAKDGNFVETTRIGKHVFGYLKEGDPYIKGLTKYRNRSEFD